MKRWQQKSNVQYKTKAIDEDISYHRWRIFCLKSLKEIFSVSAATVKMNEAYIFIN